MPNKWSNDVLTTNPFPYYGGVTNDSKSESEQLEEMLHDKLGDVGKNEFRAVGSKREYYRGYGDALEWVVNTAIPMIEPGADDDTNNPTDDSNEPDQQPSGSEHESS